MQSHLVMPSSSVATRPRPAHRRVWRVVTDTAPAYAPTVADAYGVTSAASDTASPFSSRHPSPTRTSKWPLLAMYVPLLTLKSQGQPRAGPLPPWLPIAANSRTAGRFGQESKIGEADAVGALDRFCPPRTIEQREPNELHPGGSLTLESAIRPSGPVFASRAS